MDRIVASHLRDIEDFRNYASITNLKIMEEFFVIRNDKLFFFDEHSYSNPCSFTSCCYQGKFEGYYISYYHITMIKEYEGYFSQNERRGYWIKYYPNGQKRSEGSYVNDKKQGSWTYY